MHAPLYVRTCTHICTCVVCSSLVVLLCCSAAPLLCCSAAVLLRCRAALLLCCSAAVLLGCTPGGAYICGALLSCCAALLLCCSTAVLLCCRAAALPWCAPQDSLLPMPHKLSIRCQNASSALKRRVSGSNDSSPSSKHARHTGLPPINTLHSMQRYSGQQRSHVSSSAQSRSRSGSAPGGSPQIVHRPAPAS